MTDGKREKVFGIFERISRVYDGGNRRISLGMQDRWKREFTGQLLRRTKKGARILDVCCGSGDIAIALAEKGRTVIGLDFSPAMLRQAKRKGKGIPGLTWRRGDAMALPWGDGEFDAACISFGLRNTADARQVLEEMKRVVRPGGWIGCIDSFVPPSPWIRPFYGLYFRAVMPLLGGGWRYRREYQWLWQSTKAFLSSRQLSDLFREIGCRPVLERQFCFGTCATHMGRNPKGSAGEGSGPGAERSGNKE